jgi:hypothetical protein
MTRLEVQELDGLTSKNNKALVHASDSSRFYFLSAVI